MDKAEYAAARASAIARMLPRAQGAPFDELSAMVRSILDAAGLTPEQRLDVLGGAFVAEAVSPQWHSGHSADEAHQSLRIDDGELADAVEAIAQVLIGRAESRAEARDALAELDRMFMAPAEPPLRDAPTQPGLFEA